MNNLKKIRKLKGFSQHELGSLVGLFQSQISLIERGWYNPYPNMKMRLAYVLKVKVDDLFSSSENDLKTSYDRLQDKQYKSWQEKVLKRFDRIHGNK